eukprot:1032707-Prymnesium_polylepis.1
MGPALRCWPLSPAPWHPPGPAAAVAALLVRRARGDAPDLQAVGVGRGSGALAREADCRDPTHAVQRYAHSSPTPAVGTPQRGARVVHGVCPPRALFSLWSEPKGTA